MPTVHPILVTVAAGRVVKALRRRGLPVRALVRREDERAEALPASSVRDFVARHAASFAPSPIHEQ